MKPPKSVKGYVLIGSTNEINIPLVSADREIFYPWELPHVAEVEIRFKKWVVKPKKGKLL